MIRLRLARLSADNSPLAHPNQWYIDAFHAQCALSFTPPALSGDGIVFSADGRMWLMVAIAVRMVRDVTDLPIQIHHWKEIDGAKQALSGVPNVTFVDQSHNPQHHGFATKAQAIMHSGFRRVIWLDSDAYLVNDPAPLLESVTNYRPLLYWHESLYPTSFNEQRTGITKPQLQQHPNNGMLVFDAQAIWKELSVWKHLSEHAAYWYRHVSFHDEGTLRMVLVQLGTDCTFSQCRLPSPYHYEHVGVPYGVHRIGTTYKIWPGILPRWQFLTAGEARVQALWRELESDSYNLVSRGYARRSHDRQFRNDQDLRKFLHRQNR